jgi:hypothetical protein
MPRAVTLLVICATALVATGCSQDHATDLTIEVDNGWFEGAEYRLQCDPPGGDVPRPQALCKLLDEHWETMLQKEVRWLTCAGGPSTAHIAVSG